VTFCIVRYLQFRAVLIHFTLHCLHSITSKTICHHLNNAYDPNTCQFLTSLVSVVEYLQSCCIPLKCFQSPLQIVRLQSVNNKQLDPHDSSIHLSIFIFTVCLSYTTNLSQFIYDYKGRIKMYSATYFNPLKTKRVCFIQGLSAYRAVNTLHFGYKNQSLNVL
jgi:hypothetical protein